MTKTEFQSEMFRVETLRRLATEPLRGDYYAGYVRGLRRSYHGDIFGTAQEHELWTSLADDPDDESRAARGRGYRDGLSFRRNDS